MTTQEFQHIIESNASPDISMKPEMKSIVEKYPFFQAGIFVYLKSLFVSDDESFRVELQRLSVFVTDRRALFYYVLEGQYGRFFKKKGKRKEINKSRTDILLNAFFETVDDNVIDKQLDSLSPESLPISDYFAYVETESEDNESLSVVEAELPLMKHQHIIDKFINNEDDHVKMKFDPNKEDNDHYNSRFSDNDLSDELEDDLFFTETLAGIYIKQHKYERAYEIIKRLSLNYPEKNIYFADQISFLEKLIINTKTKNKR